MKIHDPQAVVCDVFVETAFGAEMLNSLAVLAGIEGPLADELELYITWGNVKRARVVRGEMGRGLILTLRCGMRFAPTEAKHVVEKLIGNFSEKTKKAFAVDDEMLRLLYKKDAEDGI